MKAKGDAGAPFEELAAEVHWLSVLLAAGLDPMTAVRALAEESPAWRAAAGCASPAEVPDALRGASEAAAGVPAGSGPQRAWATVAATWSVAVETGAPLAATLERSAHDLRAHADVERQIDVALAGPIATARTVAFLPLAGLGLGVLLGVDVLGIVFGSVPGAAAAALGIGGLVAGTRWNRRLIAAARIRDVHAGIGPELLALALSGGASPDRALTLVAEAARECGLEAADAEAESTLAFARRAGVPASALLRGDAARARRVALTDGLRSAAVLGTRLLAPLAVCFLPAFVLLGVVPLILGILRDVLAAF
ncbi:type II secretion system F family protein [Salinibacterium sp. ZJ77]|uniref:type II secretion system F family protein n=1 Tax=Salinibacterium sp. ZJ77 TaxID=2708337 RepID=UPI00142117AE|nr:type II secretion system F family protein [Salinibacterium sp. ZJ77]